MITRFGKIHERDGRTDGRTLHDSNGRACIVPLSADFCIFFPDCHAWLDSLDEFVSWHYCTTLRLETVHLWYNDSVNLGGGVRGRGGRSCSET